MQYLKSLITTGLFGLTICMVTFSTVSAELPPEILLDQYMIAAKDFYQNKNYSEAIINLDRIEKLNATPPDVFYYIYGVVAFETKDYTKVKQSLEKYLINAGKSDPKKYKKSLVLLSQSEILHRQQIADKQEAERQRIAAEKEAKRQRILAEKREKERRRKKMLVDCETECKKRVDWLAMLNENDQEWIDGLPASADPWKIEERIEQRERESAAHWRKCTSNCQNRYDSN